jgi:hypothetical protein
VRSEGRQVDDSEKWCGKLRDVVARVADHVREDETEFFQGESVERRSRPLQASSAALSFSARVSEP